MSDIPIQELHEWCRISVDDLQEHPGRKVPFALEQDSTTMGDTMARMLVEEIEAANAEDRQYHAIIPCGPTCWYKPWTNLVNERRVSLRNVAVFHMDECLDWQGRLLPRNHPLNFRTYMEEHFYGGITDELNVPENQRHWLYPQTMDTIEKLIDEVSIDLTIGGWGQDGHIAYNQARRNLYSPVTIEDVRQSTIRIQDNNPDTILALAQRNFGLAWQFVPPMSITLGVKQCLSANKVRVYSNTGAWKQTALRIALFGPITPEFPMTLLQEHPDALVTATYDTARHPISENPEWELF